MTTDRLSDRHRLGMPLPRRIAVIRALQLGDLLCAVPALRALRAALPDAEIVLIGLPWAKRFVERFHRYLDGFLEFPGFPGLPEQRPQLERIPAFLSTAHRAGFDLAIQMHGSGAVVNPLTVLLGARLNAGYFVPGAHCPDPLRFMPYPDRMPEIRRHLLLMEFLGIAPRGEELEFPVFAEDAQAFERLEEARGLHPQEYVCVHPGARAPTRRWQAERFAAVADAIASRGLPVVLTGAPEEAALVAQVSQAMRAPHVNLAGRTTLGTLAVLLKRARLLVCNDTGVSHIAAGLQVPSVVIVTGSDPSRWAPLDRERHRLAMHPVGCRPCDYLVCPIGQPCSLGVSAELVWQQVKALLQQGPARAAEEIPELEPADAQEPALRCAA